MVFFALESLHVAGIREVLIVTGGNYASDFARALEAPSPFVFDRLEYAFQERASGVADALALARDFVRDDRMCVVLADNVFEFSLRGTCDRFVQQTEGARVVLARVDEPQHYGVPRFGTAGIERIIEKPVVPPSPFAVTGWYLYDSHVFEFIDNLVPSARGELEITDVNNLYLATGHLRYEVLEGYWADCGESFDSYLRAGTLVARYGANKPTIGSRSEVSQRRL
jgi:glucose-1-phosphate thymidylyltransferase